MSLKNFVDILIGDQAQEQTVDQEQTGEMVFFNMFGDRNGKTVNREVSQEPYRTTPSKEPSEAKPPMAAPPARGSEYIMQMIHGRTTEEQDMGWQSLQFEILVAQADITLNTPSQARHKQDPFHEPCPPPCSEPQRPSTARRAYEKALELARASTRDTTPQRVATPQTSNATKRG
jgi:hypothetical protein